MNLKLSLSNPAQRVALRCDGDEPNTPVNVSAAHGSRDRAKLFASPRVASPSGLSPVRCKDDLKNRAVPALRRRPRDRGRRLRRADPEHQDARHVHAPEHVRRAARSISPRTAMPPKPRVRVLGEGVYLRERQALPQGFTEFAADRQSPPCTHNDSRTAGLLRPSLGSTPLRYGGSAVTNGLTRSACGVMPLVQGGPGRAGLVFALTTLVSRSRLSAAIRPRTGLGLLRQLGQRSACARRPCRGGGRVDAPV